MIFRTRRDFEEEVQRRMATERANDEMWRKCVSLDMQIEELKKRMVCLEEELLHSRMVAVNTAKEVTE